jgi:hypothetical protein
VPDPLLGKYPTPATGPSSGPIQITESGTGAVCSGTGCSNVVCSGSNCTINPGIYDDICIESSGLTVDFGESGSLATGGLYVITSGATGNTVCSNGVDFHVTGGATVCNSTNTDCSQMPTSANSGVTFYLAGTTASAFIAGTATAQLTAPNTGTYEGLLFYQAADNPQTMTLLGTSTSFYQGAIYEPDTSAQLYFGGNAGFNSEAAYTLIDVGQLTMAGNPDITINSNYSSLGGGGGPLAGMINSAILVE